MTNTRDHEITRTRAVHRLAQVIAHDPGASDALRQQARDTAVSAHTVLHRLQNEKG